MNRWILGLTGGVGCGKSAILDILEQDYDALVIQADRVAHELTEPGQECWQRITDAFGREILDGDGRIDRPALGKLVFGDKEKRQQLNRLTHPAVKEEIRRRIAESRKPFIVIEAALLLEDHYESICDEIWYIYADRETRFKRLFESRGYSRERTQAVMDSQMGEEELRKRCRETIDNSRTLAETKIQLEKRLLDKRVFRAQGAERTDGNTKEKRE